MLYANPNTEGSPVQFREKYDNFINGEWTAPIDGEYFDNTSPIDGKTICQVARSKEADIEKALDAVLLNVPTCYSKLLTAWKPT